METVNISVRPRYLAGTDIAKKIRRAGLIPAVIYGKGLESRSVATDPKPLTKALNGNYGRNQLFRVTVANEEGEHLALARQIDMHPVTRKLLHVDFFVVQPDTPLTLNMPLRLLGRSAGQKVGGRLNIMQRTIPVTCTPETMPEAIEVDLTPFEGGEGMTVDEATYPEGVKPVYRKVYRLFDVSRPKLEVEEDKDEEGEDAPAEADAADE